MTPNSYLEKLAMDAIARELTKHNIDRSLSLLQERIGNYFNNVGSGGANIVKHFPFGSYTRGTMLPRTMDAQSDIDYMVVFADADVRSQTGLDRLRRFAEACYQEREIAQSHPTILLSLDHIRFELVPAIETWWEGIQIPAKRSEYAKWTSTTPNEFNAELTKKNTANQDLIKPLVRLVKYWNALNEYPFESFELENMVVDHWTIPIWLFGGTLWQRFVAFMQTELSAFWAETDHQKRSITKIQSLVSEVDLLESEGKYDLALQKLQLQLPPAK